MVETFKVLMLILPVALSLMIGEWTLRLLCAGFGIEAEF